MKQARWIILIAAVLIVGVALFFIIRGAKKSDPQPSETNQTTTTENITTAEPTRSSETEASESAAEDPTETIGPTETEPTEDLEESVIDDYVVTYGEDESIVIN